MTAGVRAGAAAGDHVAPLGMPARIALAVVLLGGLAVAAMDPFTAMFFAAYAIPSFVLAVRRPRERVGWLLLLMGFGFVGTTLPLDLDVVALEAGTASWRDFLFVWVGAWAGYATFTLLVALTLVFPSGHLPRRGRRGAIAILLVATAGTVLAAIAPSISITLDPGGATRLVPNRFAILPESPLWTFIVTDLLVIPIIVCLAIGVAWMLRRYRRAVGVERLQLRWLVASLAAVVAAITLGLASIAVLGDIGTLAWIPAICAYPTVPLAVLVAMTRYRLYEIDRIVSRTIGWAVITALLVGVFAGAVIGLQAVLSPVTENDTIAVAASTLLAFALFAPVRARVQRAVDRRFNRSRVDAERSASTFAARLRDDLDLEAVERGLLATASASVEPAEAAVWLRVRA